MNANNFSLIKVILCVAALTMLMVSPAFALPTVDGNVLGSVEGYTSFFNVSFDVKDGATGIPGGSLYTAADGTKLYYGLILPESIAANTDGLTDLQYIADYGKDELEFKYGPKENEFKLKLDYIDDTLNASVKELKWKYYVDLGDGTTQKVEVRFDLFEDFDNYVAFNTSLGYNLNGGGEWISNVMYEFSIDTLLFAGYDIPIGIGDLINLDYSKVKVESNEDALGDKDVYPTAAPVPEPATMLLLGTGLIGLAGYRKKLFRK